MRNFAPLILNSNEPVSFSKLSLNSQTLANLNGDPGNLPFSLYGCNTNHRTHGGGCCGSNQPSFCQVSCTVYLQCSLNCACPVKNQAFA